jgi:hypothetical protein
MTSNLFLFQLNTCFRSPYVTSSLTRGWVCRLQLLFFLFSALILGSESLGTDDHILCSQIRDSPNLEDQVPVFTPTRNRVAQFYPLDIGFSFGRILRLAGLRRRYSNPPTHGAKQFRVRLVITLRLAAYRESVRLGAKHLEIHDQHFFFNCILAFIVLM